MREKSRLSSPVRAALGGRPSLEKSYLEMFWATDSWINEMREMRSLLRCLLAAVLLCLLMPRLNYSDSSPGQPDAARGWREATTGYEFSFPGDHYSHPDTKIEWWYYTGNLESKTGRRFGYQLTFFRVGVVRDVANASRWALRDLYLAHFAITDIDRQTFRSFERVNRAGIGWAGADIESRVSNGDRNSDSPINVWNEDWAAAIRTGRQTLFAKEEDCDINLTLAPLKSEVIHGIDGISQKGPSAGNASHYYSLSRLDTSGQIVVGGESFEVTGLSWMDHEFGTSFLDDEQIGWNWFSLQLEDGRDLMLFEIRRQDGSVDSRSSGTLIESDGAPIHLGHEEFSLLPLQKWRSAASGATYPIGWAVEVPRFGLHLDVTATVEDQELRTPESTGVTYWEGSVTTQGKLGDKKVRGRGYLEMTGYTDQGIGEVLR